MITIVYLHLRIQAGITWKLQLQEILLLILQQEPMLIMKFGDHSQVWQMPPPIVILTGCRKIVAILPHRLSKQSSTVCLPERYTYWDAEYNEGVVDLVWGTEFEENNRDFIVQRSADGLVWETIGAVAGNNTTNEAQNYAYTDNDPLTGISYYRLMQVDTDGGIEYNTVLSVNTSDIEPFTVYPNPAAGSFNIYTKSKNIEHVVLTDMVGKTFDVAYTGTSNGLEIDCNNYAAGVYTLTVIANGTAQSQRLVIKK